MRVRELINGDLIYPNKGNPPICPPDYERDHGDPFILHKIYPPCDYREVKGYYRPCCGSRFEHHFCKKQDGLLVNFAICEVCHETQDKDNVTVA